MGRWYPLPRPPVISHVFGLGTTTTLDTKWSKYSPVYCFQSKSLKVSHPVFFGYLAFEAIIICYYLCSAKTWQTNVHSQFRKNAKFYCVSINIVVPCVCNHFVIYRCSDINTRNQGFALSKPITPVWTKCPRFRNCICYTTDSVVFWVHYPLCTCWTETCEHCSQPCPVLLQAFALIN